jgi:diguanylate cyclase (GGDEF)-like protein/PAS domain S-box-containing protein
MMPANRLANVPPPARDSGHALDAAACEKIEPIRSTEAAPPRLFRERRRTRPVEDSWHGALDVLNRLIVGYEKINEQISEAEEKYRLIFEDALVGIFQVSPAGRPLTVNRTMARIYGYDSPEQFLAEVSNVRRQLLVDPTQLTEWKTAIKTNEVAWGTKAEVNCRNGLKKWVSMNIRAVRDDRGRIQHFEGTAEDITDRKDAEERIHFLAYYDTLTGLPNRTLFSMQLGEALAIARNRQGKAALLLLELGRFKIINDSFGQLFGDRLLQEIAERIKNNAGDNGAVARVGGSEFAIVLEDIEDDSEAAEVTQKVVAALSAEFSVLGHSLSISFNIGIGIFPEHGMDGAELLQNADVALFASKEDGLNKSRFFSEEMNTQIMEQLRMENGLRQAVDRNELFLLYQPQVNIRTRKITGLEALLRWQHPQLGLVQPNKFIGVAESSGLIVPIGEWVLRTACSQAKEWQDAGLPAVPVAVNVSAVQFRQQGFPELIRSVLADTGLEPKYLELELTESLLLTNADVMFSILQELRDMGVKLAIDDFGTGYSSLSYLRQFQVNRLKIDRSFVRDVAVNRDDAAITIAIIEMAKALNLEVLAEGVETEAQLSFLRAQHCYEIQGYYFSKPVPVGRIAEHLRDASIQPA